MLEMLSQVYKDVFGFITTALLLLCLARCYLALILLSAVFVTYLWNVYLCRVVAHLC